MVPSGPLAPIIRCSSPVTCTHTGSRIMELTQEILLPVLLAAIVANTVILLLVVVAARHYRRDGVEPGATRSVLQGSLMSTSFIDRSGPSPWSSNGESAGAADAADAPASEGDGDPVDAYDVEGQGASAFAEAEPAVGAAPTDNDPAEFRAEPEPEMATETESVAASSGIDPLTGLPDLGAYTRLVAAEDLRIQRYHRPATVVIFELGGLDRLIDRLGADAADRVIPALADTMRRLARDVDHVARLAPGRFGVLLPETDEIAAINYVERVRRACELWLESGAIALSLAVGWAGTDGDPTLVEAQRLATERMYVELRREGRRVTDLQPG
jgi:diguanylate cyclase (GGDEF)-like protein